VPGLPAAPAIRSAARAARPRCALPAGHALPARHALPIGLFSPARLAVASRLALAAGFVLLAGCAARRPASRHEAYTGVVEYVRPDAGQLTVRLARVPGEEDQRLACLLSSDSEVYINDRFSRVEEVLVGDVIEFFGVHDPDPRAERFLVALAHITRTEPPAPEPTFTSPPPSTQPKEN
jgi:hypothetical protein